jgi:hypothetical protein
MSKSALDRLGARLAIVTPASDDELDQLAEVIRAYQVVLDEVKAHLVELGFSPTTRVRRKERSSRSYGVKVGCG